MTEERWLTVPEIVERLRVHEQTVRKWLREGALPGKLFGRRGGWRVKESDLNAFLEAWPSPGRGERNPQSKTAA